MRLLMSSAWLPRASSSLKRGSVSQLSSPIIFAQRANIGLPMAYAMIQPSFVRNRSDGADVCPRFSVGMRLTWIACCSTSAGLLKAIQVNRIKSEEHTSELQSLTNLVCRLLLEKKKIQTHNNNTRKN